MKNFRFVTRGESLCQTPVLRGFRIRSSEVKTEVINIVEGDVFDGSGL